MFKTLGYGIEAVQPGISPDPDATSLIRKQRPDLVVGEGILILNEMIKVRKLIAIITIETFLRSDPDQPLPVLNKRGHAILRQTVLGG